MLKTIEQHNQEIRTRIEEKEEKLYKTGVECSKCKTELRYTDPYLVLMSYPAQKNVYCPNCEFKTTILVE